MNGLYLLVGISRQGHLQSVRHMEEAMAKEPFFIGFIAEIREIHPGMGLRTMYEQFMPSGIGRDAFIALGIREGYRLRVAENPQITTRSIKNRRYANLLEGQRFTSDLFYFSLHDRHYYGVLILDVYSRRIVGWSMSENMRAENNLLALSRALSLRGVVNYENQLIHHSDRGSQYVSDDYTNALKTNGIQISMCKEVLENAHIERANGTIKNDYLRRWNIKTETQLFERMEMAVNNYNNRRHQSLKMTPIEFETFVNELSDNCKPKMEVFIYKQNVQNPFQLQINFKEQINW
jgi:putative transposase